MTTTTPTGYRPDRYLVWVRYMRMHRKTLVSSRAPFIKPLLP